MNTIELPAGSIVYNLQGDAAEIAMPHPSMRGYMVYPLYEAHHGDEETTEKGPLAHWPDTYVEAPIEKKNAEVARLNAVIAEKKLELSEIGKTRYQLESTIVNDKKRLAALQGRSATISRIEDFLDGKITHYVKSHGYDWLDEIGREITITEVAAERSGDEPGERDLKLLVLFGRSNGDLSFGLNRYSDGGGYNNYRLVWPCCSLEEAEAVAKEKTEAQLARYTADPQKFIHTVETIITNLTRFQMEIPGHLLETVRQRRLEDKRKKLVQAQSVMEKARKALEEAENLTA